MATQSQMEIQASVRMTAMENVDIQRDIQNWEKQMKSEEQRIKIKEHSEPSMSKEQNRSDIYKEEGNKSYKSGEFKKAITYYTKAIASDRSGTLSDRLYSNRAMCHFKLGNLEECVIDCDASLDINPKHDKSIFRRMEANYKLKNVQAAEKDCKLLLSMNPKHTAALDFQSRLKIEQENNKKNALQIASKYKSTIDGVGEDVQFLKLPMHKQSNAPMKRIHITNNAGSNNNIVPKDANQSNHIHEKTLPQEVVNSHEHMKSSKGSPKWSTIDSVGIDMSFIETSSEVKNSVLKSIPIKGPSFHIDSKLTKNQENIAIKLDGPAVPLTPSTFFKTWNNFKDLNDRYVWLKSIPSVGFGDLLGSQLNSVLLSELLAVFSKYFIPNNIPVMPYLREMANSEGLSLLSLMMNKDDRSALDEIFEFTKKLNEQELNDIKTRFSM